MNFYLEVHLVDERLSRFSLIHFQSIAARLRRGRDVLAVVREGGGAPRRLLDRVLELAHLPQRRV